MKETFPEIDIKISSALEKLTQIMRILLWDVAKSEGLSPIQIQFLIHLSKYPEIARSVSSLAAEFDLTKATVSDAVSTLEQKGLIEKVQGEKDKRSFILDLTHEGRKSIKRIGGWQGKLLEHLSNFPGKDKEGVLLFLMNLIKSLYDDGVITIARMCIACENFEAASGENSWTNYCHLTGKKLSDSDLNIGCPKYKSKAV